MKSANRLDLKNKLGQLGLYMVTAQTEHRGHIDIAKAAIKGGATVVQLRDKSASTRELYNYASELRKLTEAAGVMLIINDRIDIALAVGADGVHLGQEDISLEVAKRVLGRNYIIGISATNLDEAIEAAKGGADYIGLGPIFPTPSKDDAAPPMGIDGLMSVKTAVDVPIVAIGGLSRDNIEDTVKAGSDGIAVISAITSADDMVKAAQELSDMIGKAKRSH